MANNPLRPTLGETKDLSSKQMAEEMGLKKLKDYKEVNDPSSDLKSKYKSMMETREKYGEDYIDISKGLPNLQEMFIDDLAYEFYKDLTGGKAEPGTSKEVLDTVFYTQNPPNKLGYFSDNTFTLELTSKIAKEDLQPQTYSITQMEKGVSFYFPSGVWLCYVRPVLYVEYNGIKDYTQIEGLYELYNEEIDYTIIELVV